MRPPALATRAGRLGATSSLRKPRARSPEKLPEPYSGPATPGLDSPGAARGGAPSPFGLRNGFALRNAARHRPALAAPTVPPSRRERAGPRDAAGRCSSPAPATASLLAPPPRTPPRFAAPRATLSVPPRVLPGVRGARAPRNGPSPGRRGGIPVLASAPPLGLRPRPSAPSAPSPASSPSRRPVPPDPDPSEAQDAEANGTGRRSQPRRARAPRRRL